MILDDQSAQCNASRFLYDNADFMLGGKDALKVLNNIAEAIGLHIEKTEDGVYFVEHGQTLIYRSTQPRSIMYFLTIQLICKASGRGIMTVKKLKKMARQTRKETPGKQKEGKNE